MFTLCSPFLLSSILLFFAEAMHNEFDTYNAGSCQRVRRAWSTLSDADKSLYIRGLIQLRDHADQPGDNALKHNDEYDVIMAEHMTQSAVFDHQQSNWFFWHAYLIWEVESRIRNLGGEFACFAIPYWDYTTEKILSLRGADDVPLIFDDGEFLGGYGNPDNEYSVNGYSWDVTIEQWSMTIDPNDPHYTCNAVEDSYPKCSLKRTVTMEDMATISGPRESGQAMRDLSDFADYTRWFIESDYGGPGAVEASLSIMSNSYDPIWVLFHSFIQLQQFMWTDCHEYDQIAPDELDAHPEAYSAFCDEVDASFCPGQELDDAFEYSLSALAVARWSFIHSQPLTVRKAYHAPRWNIRYDLGDGEGFWQNGAVDEWCADKLNDEWFTLSRSGEVREEVREEDESALSRSMSPRTNSWIMVSDPIYILVFVVMAFTVRAVQAWKNSKSKEQTYTIVP